MESISASQYFFDQDRANRGILVTDGDDAELSIDDGLAALVADVLKRRSAGRKLIFIGNGGSAAIAMHGAIDFWKNADVEAISFNDAAQLTAISNDYSYEEVFARPMRRFGKSGDLLIATSSSGRSANILACVDAAIEIGCRVVTLSGFNEDNPLRQAGDLNFYVPSGRYGIVETVHTGLLHAAVENMMSEISREES